MTALALAGLCEVSAQRIVPSVEWEEFYDAACDFYSLTQTDGGGYLLGGVIYDVGGQLAPSGGVLLRIDSHGEVQWERIYGGQGIRSVLQTTDGGYVFAGSFTSPPPGNEQLPHFGQQDAWVVKLNAEGDKQWEKSFGGTGDDSALSIAQTLDGGFIFAGNSGSPQSGNKEAELPGGWVVKMDAEGNKQWDRSFGGERSDGFSSLSQTADGGYVLSGWSYSPPSGNKESAHYGDGDGWLIKIDPDGNKEWEKSFGGTENEMFFCVDRAADGGFILGGRSMSPPSGNKESAHLGGLDYWVVKVDAAGNKEWDRSYGSSAFTEEVHVIRQTEEGGYLLGGQSRLIKTDSQGHAQWEEIFGRGDDYTVEISDLQQTEDGGYIVSGSFDLPNAGAPASGCVWGAWAAKLEDVVSRSDEVVTWEAEAGVVLESTDDLNNEWTDDQSEVLLIGGANAIALEHAGQQRYYRLRGTGTPVDSPSLSFESLLSWPADQNQVLEFSSSRDGAWEEFAGDHGIVGASHYAIVPRDLQQHYFRTRRTE